MTKKLSTTWLRSVLRAGKAQQRAAGKLVKSLLAPVKPAPKGRRKAADRPAAAARGNAAKPVRTAKPVRAAKTVNAANAAKTVSAVKTVKTVKAVSAVRASAAGKTNPVAGSAPLPGSWSSSYHLALPRFASPVASRMNYCLYVPSARARAAPLIVMLHGCEQNAPEFAQGTHMNRLAESKGYAVLYPQQSLQGHSRRCWNWYDHDTQQGAGEVPMIVDLIETVVARHGLDRSRIYIGGISAGAAMANIIAFNHPQLIAALGLHSAPVYGAGHSTVGALSVMQRGASGRSGAAVAAVLERMPDFPTMPTILIQGMDDRVVRPINQAQLIQQSLQINRLAPDCPQRVLRTDGRFSGRSPTHAYALRDFCKSNKVLLRVAQIDLLGHAWSGGDPSLPYNAGPGPDASKMMIEFFARQRRAVQAQPGLLRA